MREAYVLLWNAAERLKQGRALRDNLEVITTKVPWIDRKEFERTADSLIKQWYCFRLHGRWRPR